MKAVSEQRARRVRVCRHIASYLAAPLIVLIVLLVSMASAHIVPFGDHPFVARDGVIQYVGFFGWFHQVLTGDASLFYSMSKGMGGATYGLFAYYLASPFNLLAVFFSPEDMPAFFSLLMPLKLCSAALTCEVYLYRRFDSRRPVLAFVASAYVLGSWSFVDGLNIMWLDGLIMLPLVALGVYRLVEGKTPILLFGALVCSIVFNWYTAYMLFLYSAFYFLAELFVKRPCSFRAFMRAVGRWVAVIVLAVVAGMVILLPVAFEQFGLGSVESGSGLMATVAAAPEPLSLFDFLKSMVIQSEPFAGATNAVKIPCALFLAALAVLFLPRSSRFKIAFFALLALLFVSVLFKPLDMVWTGFVRADSYNPRYFFLITFTLCVCAGKACTGFGEILANTGRRWVSFALASIIAVAIVLEGTLIASGCLSSTALNGYGANSASGYRDYMKQMQDAVDEIESNSYDASAQADSGFFRIENAVGTSVAVMSPQAGGQVMDDLTPMMTSAERMALGMPGLAHYSSTGSGAMKQLLGNLGYCTLPGTRSITSYHAPLLLPDSLFGVRYVIATSAPACMEKQGESFSLPAPYAQASIYENSRALPLGYAVDIGATDVAWLNGEPFLNQQMLVENLTGAEVEPLYFAANLSETAPGDASRSNANRAWNIETAARGPLYVWIKASEGTVGVWVNGEYVQTTGSFEFDNNILYAGEFSEGESVEVALTGSDEAVSGSTLSACTLDVKATEALLDRFGARGFTATEVRDGYIRGSCNVDEQQKLLLTIPADPGWHAKVDGKDIAIQSVNGLIALDVGPGDHAITLTFETPGLFAGAMLTLGGLALASCWFVAEKRCRRRRRV